MRKYISALQALPRASQVHIPCSLLAVARVHAATQWVRGERNTRKKRARARKKGHCCSYSSWPLSSSGGLCVSLFSYSFQFIVTIVLSRARERSLPLSRWRTYILSPQRRRPPSLRKRENEKDARAPRGYL